MRRWDDFSRFLVVFAAAHDVPYRTIAPIFGVKAGAIAGIVHRSRYACAPGRRLRPRASEYSRNLTFWIDNDMDVRLEAQRLPGQNTSQLLRDVFAAGLEAMEAEDA